MLLKVLKEAIGVFLGKSILYIKTNADSVQIERGEGECAFPLLLLFLYPTQRVAEGIMFLTDQSVSQSVSPVILVSATPLKLLNRIS